MLSAVETVSAEAVTLSLSDFVLFSGSGLTSNADTDLSVGGHTVVNGNIGSNGGVLSIGQTVTLSSGDFYFDEITAQGGFTLEFDLTSSNPANIYVVGDVDFNQNNMLRVKGAGTGGAFVPISQARELAGLIYMETHGRFSMTGRSNTNHNVWGGTVYASLLESASDEVDIGQYTEWYGAVYAFDSIDFADHGNWNHVTLIPEPGTVALLGLGGLAAAFRHRRSGS